MTYTNYQNERIKPNVSGTFVFNSFASCQDAIQDKAYEIFNLIIQSNNCASTINFFAWMVYLDDINGGFTVNTNIGRIDKISRQSFRQRPRFANALVPVNNLQRYTLEVTGVYTNQWTPAAGWSRSSTPYSYEHATTTNIMFNEWYSYGMRRARFTIVDNGVTNTFTQHGALLSQPSANVRRSGDMMVFDVTIPKGADVSVILSPSIALTKTNWTTINYPWSTPFTSISYSMPRLSANSQFMGVSVK